MRTIVTAYGDGMFSRYHDAPYSLVPMLRHYSVLDKGTTTICRERDGLTLPADDPYWQRGIPTLHWNCRSIVMEAPKGAKASDWRPVTPPQAGFGYPHFVEATAA